MSWSDTMKVEVGYNHYEEPNEGHIQSLRSAATALTNDKGSASRRTALGADGAPGAESGCVSVLVAA